MLVCICWKAVLVCICWKAMLVCICRKAVSPHPVWVSPHPLASRHTVVCTLPPCLRSEGHGHCMHLVILSYMVSMHLVISGQHALSNIWSVSGGEVGG